MQSILLRLTIALMGASAMSSMALAQDATAPVQASETEATEANAKADRVKAPAGQVFQLGRITVYGSDSEGGNSGQSITQSTVSAEEIWKSDRNTLDDALRTVPGVEIGNTGGSRNERLIFVRGFDRFQVPLSIDGVRIYLPADNRLDFGRFLTPDLSEIQVQKGYVSVLNGPGGMGGAINLVTRKPSKAFEGELRTGIDVGNTGDLAAFTTFGSVGTRQDDFYLQASGALRSSDGWFMSRKFSPTAVEDGGRRDFSDVKDWRGNFKAGYTPNATDEYVISYTHQEGEKHAPYHVEDPVRGRLTGSSYQRDWTWPYWNINNLSFYSHTEIGDKSYVKTKAYYSTFKNLLSSYDDSSFSTQKEKRAFDSYYKDNGYGGGIEFGTELLPENDLKAAFQYRRDNHNAWQQNSPDISSFVEPKQLRAEDTYSLGIENTYHATEQVDLVGGVSYDWNNLKRAEYFDSKAGVIANYPIGGTNAFNWQAAAIYRPTNTAELHASVSSRTRFPNLWERYSTRFGTALPNPDLGAERAINYELGWSDQVLDNVNLGANVFYSDVKDMIQSISTGDRDINNNFITQNRNIGDGRYYGVELFGNWEATSELTFGGNYTYLKRKITDPVRPDLKPVGVPDHIGYIFADWTPVENLTISPNLEFASSRWSDNSFGSYSKMSGYTLVNVNFDYAFNEQVSASAGIRNIFDEDYRMVDGFPEAGRTFYLQSRVTF